MKKSLFYWAFLVLAGMSLTACSSGDDNIADNTTPATPGSQNKTVILTGTIGVGGDETRAVDNNGKTSWEVGNVIAINYQKTDESYARTYCTITQVSSDKHFASFEATLENPKNDGYIGFAYPNDKVTSNTTPNSAYNFGFNYSAYYNDQDGTTEGISNSRLDYACTESGGEVKMAVDGSTAKLKGNALLKNQFSMFEFTLVKEGETTTNVPATELQIFIKNGDSFSSTADYIVTPTAATSKFYVALQPTESAVEGVKIVASFNNQAAAKKLDAAGVTAMTTDDEGKYICVDESAGTNQYQAYIYPSLTTPKVCEHTYGESKFVKGKLYSADLTVKDLTARAVVAHVGAVPGYWTKFIALALKDATASVVSVVDGESSAEAFASNNKVKINGTLYEEVAARDSHQPYDRVYDNIFDNHESGGSYTSKGVDFPSWESSAISSSALEGWRVPAVTDWRYIIQHFGGRSATLPKGIGDHDARYPVNLNSIEGETAMHYDQGSAQQLENFVAVINTACGNPSTLPLRTNYYWSASELDSGQETAKGQGVKIWRYNFSSGVFEWNSGGTLGDNSYIRLVLAY